MNPNIRLRDALAAAGLSQAQVANALQVDPRTVDRWIAQGRLPYPRHRSRLAKLVGRSEADLWSEVATEAGLAGQWWSCWETSAQQGGAPAVQPVDVELKRDLMKVQALDRHGPTTEASCLWRAELRHWEHEVLMGWYSSLDPAIRSNGTLYLRLHPLGRIAAGRRVGLSRDGGIFVGWAVLGRDREESLSMLEAIFRRDDYVDGGPLQRVPADLDWAIVLFLRRLSLPGLPTA